MKKLLCILLLLMFSALAFGQGVSVPVCDPINPTNCTDYFGSPNWANSPLPAGSVTGFTVVASGSGYTNPVAVYIADAIGGTGAAAGSVTLDAAGGIATVAVANGGSGYIAPQITIVDGNPNCGGIGQVACGSGAIVTATIGGSITGGMRKFVDTLTLPLAGLTLAVPDTITFPGSDFYVIELQQHKMSLHSDLPQTTLRGYVQTNYGTDTTLGTNTVAPAPISYLGPTIIGQRNRPVRVLFKNKLATGAGGNLFIPTDTTYMGADWSQNRATLHLHGGATPWISDGTTMQWTAPKGENPLRGASVQFVPDMWFDANGNVIASCAGQSTCATSGATNDPGQGNLTFFWTNQQGGRLMFYHDHALGITRLNVYAGEAAGYLLIDPAEDAALATATVPNDLAHLVPLVIQDKTFVPSAPQLAVEDPTWTAGGFGTVPGSVNEGDLWFPHIYTPNQNPADAGGANAYGRWDYGPWTLPGNQTTLLAANPITEVDVPCISSAFPNQVVRCPITPNPSGTPEGFMDTPLVNGKAYPVLHVAPEAYRFRILAAGNDRSWNLQFYLADPNIKTPDGRSNTEITMVPAIQPGTGSALPLCTAITPITNNTLFMGLATAILDGSGNPINGTGLPANCWPTFGSPAQAAGIPVQQTMWAADGRAGGVPDPRTAGPPFIQIGTEGGLLPAPVVIPSMPTGYEANTRSVTITNVSVHGLWVGPAERVDAIVDFSKFGGKTLILYNDAPTPAPAVDSRLDYFTGDGDQTSIGGAPNTLPGYGPNTRTVMQIVVDGAPTAKTPFSLPALQAALPSIFKATQPVPIVPEPTYPPASGGYSDTLSYSLISDGTFTFTPIGATLPVTYTDERKTIQELFTLDYGRMNATLGVELPLTNFLTQTTIPLGYIDPPTEIISQGDTQFWHITHNGVDTHFIHFHLFNVQVINRSAWDGTKRPPEQNELGWKDTVRMNPLEDILVALKPITPIVPFPLRDSYRLLDTTMPVGSDCTATGTLPCSIFTNLDPATNIGVQTPNAMQNFGWEYVWHCHILGHEENDMMRAIAFNVPPEAPSKLTAAVNGTGRKLTWTDNSASETGFILERATTPDFLTNVTDISVPTVGTDTNGQGITWGSSITYNDATSGSFYYRVKAIKPKADYWGNYNSTTGLLMVSSAWSNAASSAGPIAGVAPSALDFGLVAVNATSAAQTVTLSNTGTLPLTYSLTLAGTNNTDFSVLANPCVATVAVGSSCTISVTFKPSASGPESASLSIHTNDNANLTLTVSLTGAGGSNPLLTIAAISATMKYGSVVPVINFSYSPANPTLTTAPVCSTTAVKGSPVGNYPITCSGAAGSYTFNYVPGTMTVTAVPLSIWSPNASMTVGGIPAITPLYVGFVNGDTSASLATKPTCTTTASKTSPIGTYPITCAGAVDSNYIISYVNQGVLTVAKGTLTVTAPSLSKVFGAAIPTLTATLSPAPQVGTTTPAVCTTTATATSPGGTYPVTCTGGVNPNYNTIYVAGTLTVTAAPLTITAGNASMTYGGTVPTILPVYSPSNPTLTTAPTCSTPGLTSASPVGNYTSSCTGAVGNYTITYATGTVTVTKAALTITAKAASKTYGQALTFAGTEFTTSALLNGNTVTSVTLTSTGTAATANVGSYSIVPSAAVGSGLTNYTITYATTGSLTVSKATTTIAITANSPNPALIGQGVTFSFRATPQYTNSPTGLVTVTASTGERCSGALTGGVGSCAIVFTTSGTRTLTASYPGDTNFNGSTSASVNQTITAGANPLSVTSLAFGNQLLTTTSGTLTVTLTNTGTGTMTISGKTITGTNPGDFAQTNTCTGTLTVGSSCSFNVTFSPAAVGARSATLSIANSGAGGGITSPLTVSLTGTGVQPVSSLPATSTLPTFGPTAVGSTSAPQTVTLTNTGTAPLAITSIALGSTANFNMTTTCSTGRAGSLAIGASCTMTVTFKPAVGSVSGSNKTTTLNVTVGAPAVSSTITLNGTVQ